jgi:hypothetical protein
LLGRRNWGRYHRVDGSGRDGTGSGMGQGGMGWMGHRVGSSNWRTMLFW